MAVGWETSRRRDDGNDWVELLGPTRLQPDTLHRFLLTGAPEVTHIRLDVFPDAGMARVRLWGELSADGQDNLKRLLRDSLPQQHAEQFSDQQS